MDIPLEPTERGFLRGEFTDRYGAECSIQESSLATESALWLGCNEGQHTDGVCCARMHLTREIAAALIPLLQRFVEYGCLTAPDDPAWEGKEYSRLRQAQLAMRDAVASGKYEFDFSCLKGADGMELLSVSLVLAKKDEE